MVQSRSSKERYALALAITGISALLLFLAGSANVQSDLRYFGFALSVLLSSVLAGLGPALLVTSIVGMLNAYLLFRMLPQSYGLEEEAARFILFLGEGVLLSFVGRMIRDARAENFERPWAKRYLMAIFFVLAATGLKMVAWPDSERKIPFAFYFAATAATALAGGVGPGLLATLLASLCARYLFLEPVYSFAVYSPLDALRVALFIIEGIALSLLAGKFVRTQNYAEWALDRVRRLRDELWNRTEDSRALKAISRDIVWEWDLPVSATFREEGGSSGARESRFDLWLRGIHPNDRLKVLASLKDAMQQGRQEWSDKYRRLVPGKGYLHVADRALIIRDNAWHPVRVVGRSADVTKTSSSVAVGPESEGAYRALFENNPNAMLLADHSLRIIDANDAACDVLGYNRETLAMLSAEDLFPASARGLLLGLKPEEPLAVTFEEDCVRSGGEVFRAKISAAIVSGIEKTAADRVITIEEIAEAETTA
jgi:PAS domain S-box-containing protein